jgi:hypothetical protein
MHGPLRRPIHRPRKRATPAQSPLLCRGYEPPLADLLADPIVHRLMQADQVGIAELRAVLGWPPLPLPSP